jgi:hypothetical protein
MVAVWVHATRADAPVGEAVAVGTDLVAAGLVEAVMETEVARAAAVAHS